MDNETSNSSDNPEQPTAPKQKDRQLKKSIRNVFIGTFAVLLVLVGAGVAYTWWMGMTPPPAVEIEEVNDKKVTLIEATPVADNAPVSASVQSLTSPVIAGQNVLLTVKTKPGATCDIKVEYNKIPSKDSGLVARTSDDFGVVSWTWTVDPTAPVGKWPVTVTCVLGDRSAVVVGDLIVTDEVEE